MSTSYKTDILIIGAGPVGIFAAYQAGLLGMQSIVVDAQEQQGGQLTTLYPLKPIYDIPGFPHILAKDLVANLLEQAQRYNPTYLMQQKVTTLNREQQVFIVETTAGNTIQAQAIIIAGGAGAFGPNRLPIEGLSLHEGRSVFYNINDPQLFKNKTVVIAGGGDSAVDWAINLAEGIANKVYLVHRREAFRALPASLDKLKQLKNTPKLEMLTPYTTKDIVVEDNNIKGIVIESIQDKSLLNIEAEFLLPFFGLKRDLAGLSEWGLQIDKINGTILCQPSSYETNIAGIYAVGDMAKYEHKLKLIMVGFSEVAYAIHHCWQYVFPDKPFRFIHSTSKV